MPSHLIRVVAVATLAICHAKARAVIIDDFSVGAISIVETTAPVTQVQTGLDPAHVAGGERRLLTGIYGGNGPGKSIVVDPTTKTMIWDSGPVLGYFRAEYGSQSTPLGIDLAANGETHLEVVFKKTGVNGASSAQAPNFFVESPTGSGPLPFGAAIPFHGDSYVARAAFTDFPTIDFRNLSRLWLEVTRYTRGATVTVYSIQSVAIPEPTAGLLFVAGAGLLSIAVRRR